MKKNVLKLFSLGCLAIGLNSCNEDFLDRQPSEFVTADQLTEAAPLNPDLIAGSIDGIYTVMFTSGSGNTTGHDDFGQKSYDIFSDMLSGSI